jgi:hypothetical protein
MKKVVCFIYFIFFRRKNWSKYFGENIRCYFNLLFKKKNISVNRIYILSF